MSENWVGITVQGQEIIVIQLQFNDEISLIDDDTWGLPTGERPDAYRIIYTRIRNYLSENDVENVVIKGSAVSRAGVRLAHLKSAELRGVVITAAAQSGVRVTTLQKAHASRVFGKRKVDQYVDDDHFWQTRLEGSSLRKGSRETALLILTAREQ